MWKSTLWGHNHLPNLAMIGEMRWVQEPQIENLVKCGGIAAKRFFASEGRHYITIMAKFDEGIYILGTLSHARQIWPLSANRVGYRGPSNF